MQRSLTWCSIHFYLLLFLLICQPCNSRSVDAYGRTQRKCIYRYYIPVRFLFCVLILAWKFPKHFSVSILSSPTTQYPTCSVCKRWDTLKTKFYFSLLKFPFFRQLILSMKSRIQWSNTDLRSSLYSLNKAECEPLNSMCKLCAK